MPSEPTFRIQTSTLFLTYAQCPLSKEALLEALSEKLLIKEYAIAQELHANGDPHLHAFIKLTNKLNTRDVRFADIGDYHPNITRPRSIKNVIDYIMKDGMTSYT